MSESPFRGAFPHQHGDARGLLERIEAQLRERIEEAVEMAAIKIMVDRRAAAGLAARGLRRRAVAGPAPAARRGGV